MFARIRPLVARLAASAAAAAILAPTLYAQGQWSPVYPWPYVNETTLHCLQPAELSHAALVPAGPHAGKVLMFYWSRNQSCETSPTDTFWFFNPDSPSDLIKLEQQLASNLFCSGHSWSALGRLVVAGGEGPPASLRKSYTFNPFALGPILPPVQGGYSWMSTISPPWTTLSDLAIEHFYPTVIALGRKSLTFTNPAVPTIPVGGANVVIGGPDSASLSGPGSNEAWEFLAVNGPSAGEEPHRLLLPQAPDIVNTQLLGLTAEHYVRKPGANQGLPHVLLDSYPRSLLLSNGHIFVTGDVDTFTAGEAQPNAAWVMKPRDLALNPPQPDWEFHSGQPEVERYYGTAVLLHMRASYGGKNRVLVFGGSRDVAPPTWYGEAQDTVRELAVGSSGNTEDWEWKPKQPMARKRVFANAVVLPSGQIVLTQGSQVDYQRPYGDPTKCPDPQNLNFAPELYDPGNAWNDPNQPAPVLLAESSIPPSQTLRTPRVYHHVALLLRDGRILVAGGQDVTYPGGQCSSNAYPECERTGEVFSPPYLFLGYRPQFAQPPSNRVTLSGGATVQFQVDAAITPGNSIAGVNLVRPASVTHHFDNDQRLVELEYTASVDPQGNATITVDSPHESLAPPGYYMLFVLEAPSATSPRDQWAPSVGEFIRFN